ncbi:putative membrane protein [Propionispora sp. 2/2-37]|uniref:FecCD family ABC transporter permease n=1 Tax=Propionispora sp. 2/2-37 TaxID=1677858 RepID=UPI0006BB6A56|nr:iron ABC transporter permease [Propionispora sp. 2/2-37]CUH94738.1 putative membrane protein [Propionispora sp. 2/2-37]
MSDSSRRFAGSMLAGGGVLALLAFWSLSYGMIELSFTNVIEILLGIQETSEYDLLIYDFRLPRLIIAALAGAGLAIAGCLFQGVSRNGLADPGLLGVNSGAGLAIVIFMFFYQGTFTGTDWSAVMVMPFFGLLGGLGSSAAIYLFSWKNNRLDPQRFLITGIAMASGFTALTLFFTLKMNPADFQAAMVWSLGSLQQANWQYIASVLPWFLLILPVAFQKSRILDLFQLEESTVKSLGISVGKEQAILLLSASALVSACVAVSGSIGFIGLIIPHIAKRLVGVHHEYVLPFAGLLGMIFLVAADFIAKNVFAPAELAVGIVISLLGVPYFIYLLANSRTD